MCGLDTHILFVHARTLMYYLVVSCSHIGIMQHKKDTDLKSKKKTSFVPTNIYSVSLLGSQEKFSVLLAGVEKPRYFMDIKNVAK